MGLSIIVTVGGVLFILGLVYKIIRDIQKDRKDVFDHIRATRRIHILNVDSERGEVRVAKCEGEDCKICKTEYDCTRYN